ncbi:MAG: SprB repeat-containing protein, partial [Flavobacteriales bacterium]
SNDSATGLCAGCYAVVVTDNNNCNDTATVCISEPGQIDIDLTVTDALCKGSCNGTIDAEVSGGVQPYSYEWFDGSNDPIGQTDTMADNLCAGDYYVEVTDDNGIVETSSLATVNEPASLTANTSVVSDYNGEDISCNGACDGSADVTPSGGTSPYSYEWMNSTFSLIGQTSQTATNLCAGTYYVEVTDDNGCIDTFSVLLTEPAPLTTTMDSTNISCFGACDGDVSTTPSGGTPGYDYQWDDPDLSTTATIDSLCPGTYTVDITDTNGCSLTDSTSITQPTELVLDTSVVNSNCNQPDGEATVQIVSGVSPFTYQWDDAADSQTAATADSLVAGCYDVEVTDGNGCTETKTACVTDNGSPTMDVLDVDSVSCNGACDGFAQVQVSGGTSPYTYHWLDANNDTIDTLTNPSESGLCAQQYTVISIDSNGCKANVSLTVEEPLPLSSTISSAQDVTCFGDCDGEATVLASGGTTPYTYQWNDPNTQTTTTADSLCPGTYNELKITTSTDSAYCNTATGAAYVDTVSGNGGVTPLNYTWEDGQSNDTAFNLTPGDYWIEVTDADSCIVSDTVSIGNIPPGRATISNTTDVSCNGACDGTATVSMSGGNPDFDYEWFSVSSGSIGQDTSTATGLCAGDYYVVVTDTHTCTSVSDTVTITEPAPLTATTSVTDATCNSACDGNISATPSGGTSPYSYQWDDNLGQTDSTATGLCAGIYTVTITDDNGCTITATDTVDEPAPIEIDSSVVNAHCGQNDGSACISATGGTTPYDYSWNLNGDTTKCTDSLFAGTYTAKVIDSNNCSKTIQVTVADESGPSITITDSTNITCNGDSNGTATAMATGGTTPYSYQWNDPDSLTTATATNLGAGTYIVEVTDSAGCKASTTVTLTEPDALTSNLNKDNPQCYGDCNGKAWVNSTGGNPPYNFTWINSSFDTVSTNDTAFSLCDGTYSLNIKDDSGCTMDTSITLNEPTPVQSTTSVNNVNCNGQCNGSATVAMSNGVSPATYQWDAAANNQTTQTARNLCAGTYNVIVTDDEGCKDTTSATVTQPAPLTSQIVDSSNISCNGACDGFAEVSASGGTTPYTYSWSNNKGSNAIATDLCARSYTVTVTDDNGCQSSTSVTLTEPNPLAISLSKQNLKCYGECNGEIAANVSGGTTPYNYDWGVGIPNSDTASNLCAGDHTVTVTDSNGCTISASASLTQPQELTINADIMNSNCGQSNGEIHVNTIGGKYPYTYQWDDPNTQTSANADSLSSGCYTLEILDNNGCQFDSTLCVDDIEGPTIDTININNISCYGLEDGLMSFDVYSGTPSYEFTWYVPNSPNDSILYNFSDTLSGTGTSTADSLGEATHVFEVEDAAGCVTSAIHNITEPSEIKGDINKTDVSCFGATDGEAEINVVGGIPPYTYSWNTTPTQTDSIANNLTSGTYTVTINDSNECQIKESVTISQPDSIRITLDSMNSVSCNGSCDGEIFTSSTGGVAPHTYNWTNTGQTNSDIFNLCAGKYKETVTDANNCTQVDSFVIDEPTPLTLDQDSIPATCGDCNGGGIIYASGGTPPYSYSWPNGDKGKRTTGLCAGTHTVTVKDDNGCSANIEIEVTNMEGPIITGFNVTEPICYETNTGKITVQTSNGTTPLNYQWGPNANNQITQTAINLEDGTYNVTVTDSNGCTTSGTKTIEQPDSLMAIKPNDKEICFGESTQLTANAQGGTSPFEYKWSHLPDSISEQQITVSPDNTKNYCFKVVDDNGCISDKVCITVTVNPKLQVSGLNDLSICKGDSTDITANFSGGNGDPYTIMWTKDSLNGQIIDQTTGLVNEFGIT